MPVYYTVHLQCPYTKEHVIVSRTLLSAFAYKFKCECICQIISNAVSKRRTLFAKMGVKGLSRFIIKFEKNVMERIEMRKEIEDWKE